MKDAKGYCLSCKFYRLDDINSGVCRVDKGTSADYPQKHTDDQCSRWLDSGQQYFIRVGWIKAKKAESEEEPTIKRRNDGSSSGMVGM
ncbi:MAG: hypothetical protein V2B20_03505 [Pseudomonadota bacterium]